MKRSQTVQELPFWKCRLHMEKDGPSWTGVPKFLYAEVGLIARSFNTNM